MLLITTSFEYILYGFDIILIMILVLIIGVLIYNYIEYKKLIKKEKWSKIIDEKILDVIVNGHEKTPIEKEDLPLYESLRFRNLFIQKLVASEKKFSGDAENEIIHLFQNYQLEKDALEKLNQKKNYQILI